MVQKKVGLCRPLAAHSDNCTADIAAVDGKTKQLYEKYLWKFPKFINFWANVAKSWPLFAPCPDFMGGGAVAPTSLPAPLPTPLWDTVMDTVIRYTWKATARLSKPWKYFKKYFWVFTRIICVFNVQGTPRGLSISVELELEIRSYYIVTSDQYEREKSKISN